MVKVLTLNLCASWASSRKQRLRMVADFVKANGIDVILCQEGVRICYPVYDSLRYLAGLLGYDYIAKSAFGFPWLYEFRVGMISRYKIAHTAALSCEVPQTDWLDAIPLPWRARAVAAIVDVPDLGITALVSVHLTSAPKTDADKAKQLQLVSGWIAGLPARDVTICGGDFNTSFEGESPFFLRTGQTPDYIFVAGAALAKGYPVISDYLVSDHVGIVAEVKK